MLTNFLSFHDFLNMNILLEMIGLFNLSYTHFLPPLLAVRRNVLECFAEKNTNTMLEIGGGPYKFLCTDMTSLT